MFNAKELLGGSGRVPDVIVEERISSSFNIATTFTDRTLNTVVRNKDSLGALASNALTLPAGTYEFEVEVTCAQVGNTSWMHRLYNTTAAAVAGLSSVEFWPSGTNGLNQQSRFSGTFTLAASSALKLQGIASASMAVNGGGFPGSNTACLARLKIWKVNE